jgi:sugar phosphate isomerase/epimerase
MDFNGGPAMKISFMTLGCPKWDLDTICARGKKYGFDGVDFRGYLETIDITMRPEFTRKVSATYRQLKGAGLAVSAISSSINLCVLEKLESNLEEARRTIPVAQALACANMRVFGGGDLNAHSRPELAEIGRDAMQKILALDGASSLHWLFETHDQWIRAQDTRLLLDQIPNPAFGALWDMGHTYRVGKETPNDTFEALKGRIGYTHLKDAVYDPSHPLAMEDGWHYVLPGTGSLPLRESIDLLKQSGYDGWFQFEHEKRWHPELPEPEVAFPAFARWIRPLITTKIN